MILPLLEQEKWEKLSWKKFNKRGKCVDETNEIDEIISFLCSAKLLKYPIFNFPKIQRVHNLQRFSGYFQVRVKGQK